MIIGNNLKIFLLLWIFILFYQNSKAQEIKNETEIETKTLELYNNKNWSTLILIGNEAINNGTDYYYLRMRLGIAYYEQKNYCLAIEHFKSAIIFNSTDDLANEYLYYSNIFLARDEEARQVSATFSLELKEKVGLTNVPAIDFIAISGGIKTPNSSFSSSNNPVYFKTANFYELGLKHFIKNNFSLFHAVNIFNQETYSGKINQNQYFAQASIPLKNNWSIVPAFHVLQLKFTSKISGLNNETSTNNYFVGSVLVKKSIKKFDFSIGSTFSNIASNNQYNHFGNITCSVFGNSHLVVGLTDYLHTSNKYATLNNSFSGFVYFQPLKFASVKLSYFKNQNNNIIEDNGYLVNNSVDLTTNRFSALINFSINKTISIFGLYQLEKKQVYVLNSNYQYNVFMLGLKINAPF